MFQRISSLVVKELLATLRDKKARIALIVPPILQLFVFAFAGTQEVTNISLAVFNQDSGRASAELVQRLEASGNFSHVRFVGSTGEMQAAIDRQLVVAGVRFQDDFSARVLAGQPAPIQLVLDGRRSNAAQIVQGYVQSVVEQFGRERAAEGRVRIADAALEPRNWFNPNLTYLWFTVPSLVAMITTLTALNVTSMSVAREREMGTFDQLLVSPLHPLEILAGKALPAFGLALAQATIFLVVAVLVFRIPFRGSPPLLYGALVVFIAAMVGVGLFISSLSATQQQALLGTFTFMVPAMLLSGYASPIENMPVWLQPLTYANPLRYMMVVVKGVYLKALPAAEVFYQVWPMLLIAAATVALATSQFRRRAR